MALLNEGIENSVVAIGIKGEGSSIQWIGTGFIVFAPQKTDPNKVYPCLISNRHVLEKKESIFLRVMGKDGKVVEKEIELPDRIAFHPDPSVDVAAVLLPGKWFEDHTDYFSGLDLYKNIYTIDEYLANGGYNGSAVFMLGFPLSLVSPLLTTPICRRGCVARINELKDKTQKIFLLDIQNFPGNSGSPILCCPDSVSLIGTKQIREVRLIGIVCSYIPYSESLMNTQTKKVVEVRQENSGIACAVPADCVREAIVTLLTEKGLLKEVVGFPDE